MRRPKHWEEPKPDGDHDIQVEDRPRPWMDPRSRVVVESREEVEQETGFKLDLIMLSLTSTETFLRNQSHDDMVCSYAQRVLRHAADYINQEIIQWMWPPDPEGV